MTTQAPAEFSTYNELLERRPDRPLWEVAMTQEYHCTECGTRNWLGPYGGEFTNRGTCEYGCNPANIHAYTILAGHRVHKGTMLDLFPRLGTEGPRMWRTDSSEAQ